MHRRSNATVCLRCNQMLLPQATIPLGYLRGSIATKTQPLSELERRLTLTSPPMRGERVRELQLMLRHNPFGTFEPGRDAGLYDEQTAAATRRAWYWIGCPEQQIGEHADGRLFDLLAGGKELPGAW